MNDMKVMKPHFFVTEAGWWAVSGGRDRASDVLHVHTPADKTTTLQVLRTGNLQANIPPNLGKVVPSEHLCYGKIEDNPKPIRIAGRSIVFIRSTFYLSGSHGYSIEY